MTPDTNGSEEVEWNDNPPASLWKLRAGAIAITIAVTAFFMFVRGW